MWKRHPRRPYRGKAKRKGPPVLLEGLALVAELDDPLRGVVPSDVLQTVDLEVLQDERMGGAVAFRNRLRFEEPEEPALLRSGHRLHR